MSKKAKQTFEIDFEPIGRRIQVGAEDTLLDAARASGVQIASLCGGAGLCESCIVRPRSGTLSALTLEEHSAREEGWLKQDERLACQAHPASDVTIDVPAKSLTTSQRLQLEGQSGKVRVDPVTRAVDLNAELPTGMPADEMILALIVALEELGVEGATCDPSLSEEILTALETYAWKARIILRDEEIIAVLPAGQVQLGVAVDLGTTKIAAFLVDIETGETLAQAGAMNPQISYGEDVISRISYANKDEGARKELQRIVVKRLNELIQELCASIGASSNAIVEAVAVGNTVMHHAFLGLPLRQLGVSPFSPAIEGSVWEAAKDVGLDTAVGARIYLPPNIAGYVGADHTAMLLAVNFADAGSGTLAIDIGTNTEISLQLPDRTLSCSCASGPAFEGAHIRDGMRAAPGAIERVQPSNGGLRWQTIDDLAPIGICGSGILDAVAAFQSLGWIDRSGRLNEAAIPPESRHAEGICLVRGEASGHGSDIIVTRHDIHEIQLAQAAIRAGIEVLLQDARLTASDLQGVYLAGAFGSYINITSAMQTGMLPRIDLARFFQIGNAAGEGARQLLLSKEKRLEVEKILDRVVYIELTTHPAFTDLYMQYLYLG